MITINPGAGAITGATVENACANMEAFVADLKLPGVLTTRRPSSDDSDGRFEYLLHLDGRTCTVNMPGLPLTKVRYRGKPQNIWDFPRLYVDGSSWVWKFAVNQAREALTGRENED